MVILDLWGISFHPAVVVGLGNDLLFNSILAHCAQLPISAGTSHSMAMGNLNKSKETKPTTTTASKVAP